MPVIANGKPIKVNGEDLDVYLAKRWARQRENAKRKIVLGYGATSDTMDDIIDSLNSIYRMLRRKDWERDENVMKLRLKDVEALRLRLKGMGYSDEPWLKYTPEMDQAILHLSMMQSVLRAVEGMQGKEAMREWNDEILRLYFRIGHSIKLTISPEEYFEKMNNNNTQNKGEQNNDND